MYKKALFILCIGLIICGVGGWADPQGDISENGSENIQESDHSPFDGSNDEEPRSGLEDVGFDETVLMDSSFPEEEISGNILGDNGESKEEGVSFNGNEELKDIPIDEEGISFNESVEEGISFNESKEEGISDNENEEIECVSINEENRENTDKKEPLSVSANNNDIEEIVSSNEIKQQNEQKDIINVSMPTKVQIQFDPLNLNGKGDVYSEKYQVVNYGNRDVALKIKSMDISYGSEDEQYEMVSDNEIDSLSKKKIMNIDIVWHNKSENIKKVLYVRDGKVDEYVIYLKAAKYDEDGKFERLNEGSSGEFYFTGTLNPNPDIQWNDREIAVDYRYDIDNVMEGENKEKVDRFISENSWNQDAIIP